MPFDGNKWNTKKMVSFREMLKIVAQKYPIESIQKLPNQPNDTSKVSRKKRSFSETKNVTQNYTKNFRNPYLKNCIK